MILSSSDRQIRLLFEEQSDQGLHCLQFRLHLLDALLYGKAILLKKFRVITAICLGHLRVKSIIKQDDS